MVHKWLPSATSVLLLALVILLTVIGLRLCRVCALSMTGLRTTTQSVLGLQEERQWSKIPVDLDLSGHINRWKTSWTLSFDKTNYDAMAGITTAQLDAGLPVAMAAGTAIYVQTTTRSQCADISNHYYILAEPAPVGSRSILLRGSPKIDLFGDCVGSIVQATCTFFISSSAVAWRPDATLVRVCYSSAATPAVTHLPLWLAATSGLSATTIVNETALDIIVYTPDGTSFSGGNSWIVIPARDPTVSSIHITFDGRALYHFQ